MGPSHVGAGDGSVGLFDVRSCGAITRLPVGSNSEVKIRNCVMKRIHLNVIFNYRGLIKMTIGHIRLF